jgi:hypothetical protein
MPDAPYRLRWQSAMVDGWHECRYYTYDAAVEAKRRMQGLSVGSLLYNFFIDVVA